jgi:hypothetical protein
MTRRQRSRLVTAITALVLIATILNIGRNDGWETALQTCGILVLCVVLLTLILAWERRGNP